MLCPATSHVSVGTVLVLWLTPMLCLLMFLHACLFLWLCRLQAGVVWAVWEFLGHFATTMLPLCKGVRNVFLLYFCNLQIFPLEQLENNFLFTFWSTCHKIYTYRFSFYWKVYCNLYYLSIVTVSLYHVCHCFSLLRVAEWIIHQDIFRPMFKFWWQKV